MAQQVRLHLKRQTLLLPFCNPRLNEYATIRRASSFQTSPHMFLHVRSTGNGSGRGPVYIVEVGTGHGRLTYHVLRHLVSMRDAWPTPAPMAEEVGTSASEKHKSPRPPFLWVSTDFSSSNIRFLRQHEPLRPLVEAGLLDFAIFGKNFMITACNKCDTASPARSRQVPATQRRRRAGCDPALARER